jgi:hypothetical protein
MGILEMMSMAQKLKLANALHAFLKPEKPFVRGKFKSNELADSTLMNLTTGVPREELIRLMKSVGISQDVIDEVPRIAKPVLPEARTNSVMVDAAPKFFQVIPALTMKAIKPKQKVALYNLMHKHVHGKEHKPVRKFKTDEMAITSLNCVAKNFSREATAEFMKKTKLPKPLWEPLLEPLVGPDISELFKKPIRHETNPILPPGKSKLRMSAQRVLAAIQNLIPDARTEHKTKVKGRKEVTSTQVSQYLKTSTHFICETIRAELFPARLVTYDDDTPDNGVEFLYIELTVAGREFKCEPGLELIRLPSPTPGPRSKFAGDPDKPKSAGKKSTIAKADKKIYKLVKANPRKEGTWGWKSFNLIKDGMSYAEYKAAGGRNNDLSWDISHKFVEVR